MIPSYVDACSSGLIHRRIETAWGQLSSCRLCPRRCKKDRLAKKTGYCRTTDKAVVASYGPHFGEEAPLVGSHGLDDAAIGERVDHRQLAEIMVELQGQGCHNINFVTPTHVVPQILKALPAAVEMGLHLPLIYNSSGYDEVETLRLLDGIIDIYMPDFKFWSPASAARYTGAGDYP